MVNEKVSFEGQEEKSFKENLALYTRAKNLKKSVLKLINEIEGEKKNGENIKSERI